jgi:hypothetical protein
MAMEQETIYICRVCRRVLDLYTDRDGVRLQHTFQDGMVADHEADPVPASQMEQRGRCDFCNADFPEFEVPVRDFIVPDLAGHASAGNWAACRPCAGLIEADRWNALLRRRDWGSPEREAAARRLWRAVRRNITGSIRPIS